VNIHLRYLMAAVAWLILANPVHADDTAILTWEPNTETDLAGYKIYMSTKSGQYGAPIAIIGKKTNYEVTVKATKDTKYYFTITAYNKAGKESYKSNEVSKIIKGMSPIAGNEIRYNWDWRGVLQGHRFTLN
jgi:fibronectin type 3 domain-containing protein